MANTLNRRKFLKGSLIESGAEFICVGIFDFQIVENTALAERALKALAQAKRARQWMA
jgi:hypothetical protein